MLLILKITDTGLQYIYVINLFSCRAYVKLRKVSGIPQGSKAV